jgi:hypothetical protein
VILAEKTKRAPSRLLEVGVAELLFCEVVYLSDGVLRYLLVDVVELLDARLRRAQARPVQVAIGVDDGQRQVGETLRREARFGEQVVAADLREVIGIEVVQVKLCF